MHATQTPNTELSFTTQDLFDVETYPIHQPGSAAYDDLLRTARDGLNARNCAQLANFIRPDVIARMQEEAEGLSNKAVYHKTRLNPYFSDAPDDLPADHPVKRYYDRRHGMVRGDMFARDGVIWSVFQNQDLCDFVAAALGYDKLYTYRDPYACTNVNIQPDGCEFPWHFDNNDFTISLGLKQSALGGDFEYVPNLRTTEDENYDAVQQVLDGDRSQIQSLKLRAGDLQLFRGGYTLHRVTAPQGEERQSLLLSYVTDASAMTTSDKAIRIWGEAAPEHYAYDQKIAS